MADDGDPSHRFSEGEGFDDPYEGFDLEPEFDIDPSQVDPVDSRVLTDNLDVGQLPQDDIDVERLIEIGIEYTQINRYEQATETFERVARLTDDDRLKQEARVNKGAAHAQLEEYDAAIGAYQEALRIDEESEHAATAETNLAYALWESGRSEQALSHSERAVELDPRFGQAWYNRGFFLAERGLAEDAVDCFNNALRLGFRNADILEEKATALEELGKDEEAEEVAAQAEEIRQQAESRMME
ncbi:tetratricopeptide repeat protein [Halocatena salina]|uniref:Tetratricopeptide repeat protein n=1 Tax=Halocatena salina TaxID=2934340 RepID=A0A8T9ZZK6_9EURY|nr:tetratricopeptide repeat protein [Halocatena salina]UPM42232.1 tetratricopeptide repeat protein [Halocatena salina]